MFALTSQCASVWDNRDGADAEVICFKSGKGGEGGGQVQFVKERTWVKEEEEEEEEESGVVLLGTC